MHQCAKCSSLAGWTERNYLRLQQQLLEKVFCHFEATAPWSCSGAYCSQEGCKHFLVTPSHKLQSAGQPCSLCIGSCCVQNLVRGAFSTRDLDHSIGLGGQSGMFGPVVQVAQRHSRSVNSTGRSVRWGYGIAAMLCIAAVVDSVCSLSIRPVSQQAVTHVASFAHQSCCLAKHHRSSQLSG